MEKLIDKIRHAVAIEVGGGVVCQGQTAVGDQSVSLPTVGGDRFHGGAVRGIGAFLIGQHQLGVGQRVDGGQLRQGLIFFIEAVGGALQIADLRADMILLGYCDLNVVQSVEIQIRDLKPAWCLVGSGCGHGEVSVPDLLSVFINADRSAISIAAKGDGPLSVGDGV